MCVLGSSLDIDCFVDCQTILNFFRSLVLHSTSVFMIKSQNEVNMIIGLKWMSAIWLPFSCHKWKLPLHCIIWWFVNFQSVRFISLLHCNGFHFYYKQSSLTLWFWSFSCVWEWSYVQFFLYILHVFTLEITEYSHFYLSVHTEETIDICHDVGSWYFWSCQAILSSDCSCKWLCSHFKLWLSYLSHFMQLYVGWPSFNAKVKYMKLYRYSLYAFMAWYRNKHMNHFIFTFSPHLWVGIKGRNWVLSRAGHRMLRPS